MDTPHHSEAVGSLLSLPLLKLLRDIYPLKRPSMDMPDRGIWMLSGQQSVLEFLEEAYDAAHTTRLTPEAD